MNTPMNTEQRELISDALDLGLTYVKSRFAPWSHNVQQEDEATIRQAVAALSQPASAAVVPEGVSRKDLVMLADVALRELGRIHEMLDDAIAKCELAKAEPADGAVVAPIFHEIESMMVEFKACWPSDTSKSRRDRANELCNRFLRLRDHLRGWKGDKILPEWTTPTPPAAAQEDGRDREGVDDVRVTNKYLSEAYAKAEAEVTQLRAAWEVATAYVAARDAYDHEADKYGHESNKGPMVKVRAAVMKAVREYRATVAALSLTSPDSGKEG
jgi:hypothetical protein